MWGPILGGFAILGVFLTLSAWINGRSIKKYIGELIKEESRATREILAKLSDQHETMIKQYETMVKQYETMINQHETMVKILAEIAKTKAS